MPEIEIIKTMIDSPQIISFIISGILVLIQIWMLIDRKKDKSELDINKIIDPVKIDLEKIKLEVDKNASICEARDKENFNKFIEQQRKSDVMEERMSNHIKEINKISDKLDKIEEEI